MSIRSALANGRALFFFQPVTNMQRINLLIRGVHPSDRYEGPVAKAYRLPIAAPLGSFEARDDCPYNRG